MKDILPELNHKEYIENLGITYDIHFCGKEEVEDLIEFIDLYWKKDHIFVLSRSLFDWQHYDSKKERYNFVVARSRKNGEIHSILGFVPTSQFDDSIERTQVWPCIWKSRDDIHVKGLGVSLYHYMKTHLDIETIAILGISEIALSIYKHWNFSTGKIEQYYYPNMEHTENLSCHMQKPDPMEKPDREWGIKEVAADEYEKLEENHRIFHEISVYKSKNYYINRYYRHPIYQYLFYAIMNGGNIDSIIVARECGNGTSRCLRIVDCIGRIDHLPNIRWDLRQLMIQHNYEYIDFVTVGIQPDILKKAGFIDRKSNPKTIIPNYFEPFLHKNINLDYAFKSVDPNVELLFYKADADQDRPNVLS